MPHPLDTHHARAQVRSFVVSCGLVVSAIIVAVISEVFGGHDHGAWPRDHGPVWVRWVTLAMLATGVARIVARLTSWPVSLMLLGVGVWLRWWVAF